MSTIQDLFQQAQLAEAAYANFINAGVLVAGSDELKAALTNSDAGGTFTTTQATTFATRYQVVSQFTASGGLLQN